MSEAVGERSAGIWVALVIYVLGGGYLLGFWSLLDRAAYHLAILGIVSVVIAISLLRLSRWAYWLGLFTFPLCLVDVAYALLTSVNFVGWNPNTQTLAFNASMVIYLVFLCFGFLLLIDRRSVLRSDAILDILSKFSTAKASAGTPDKPSK
ncbi:MAG: hypothetical protein ABSD41_10765 [Candidatus Bathyarchaeia archaeon]